ncbi:DUF4169 family protein [Alphaproteobacteria bacterium KMM 3653]|uniref:DUF4169 family protein n=1 Tax=Harenicola maris TaxID=2841044 RepID=A0AAP2G780_9RHOB|nr:DUF4169 family protein [Harenicola maris]
MAKVVNLNKVLKARAKSEKQAKGDANAIAFGRSKAERLADKSRAQKDKSRLDGHLREPE